MPKINTNQLLLSSTGDGDMARLNPHLSQQQRSSVRSLAQGICFLSNREAHAGRALAAASDLLNTLERPKPDVAPSEVILKADTLAGLLATKRHIVEVDERHGPSHAAKCCDPRFLVFEFIYGILLREAQVSLVRSFAGSLQKGESHCEQMIMGGGKTTVVAPLLALMLADGDSLVVQVVPTALLEFSRSTMRERFSAVVTKSIYTFNFDRYAVADQDLVLKLERARKSRYVMCTNQHHKSIDLCIPLFF